jgi:GNAT superfamily N-acetyltransferase
METIGFTIRPVAAEDRPWVDALIAAAFGSPVVVSRGQVLRPSELDGFVAEADGERVGLATVHADERGCEVVSLNSLRPGAGIGRALLARAEQYARERGCRRLWLITTNDNTRALRMYQRFGMRIAAVHLGAVDAARTIKPEIPLTGDDGIPIHDEIELAMELSS